MCKVDYVDLGSTETILHAAPLSFDASTFEIWGALANGGCCALRRGRADGEGLGESIRDLDVTTAWLTSGLFNAIVDTDVRQLAGLRQLLTGGGAMSLAHARKALAALPIRASSTATGPTECTTFAAVFDLPRSIPED